jgi:penicillin-binding protein A
VNKPLRRVGLAVIVMIFLLLANASYVQVINADAYSQNPLNPRALLAEYSRQRGQILASGGQQLATVAPTNDRLKFLRTYTNGPMYAPVTGYFSSVYGAGGLERVEDPVLNGTDSRLFVPRLSDLLTGRDPRGGNVGLTIDPAVQQAAYDAMTAKNFTGSVVALDPKTGAILGMVSTPSYDPNPLASHDQQVQQQAWAKYNPTTADAAHPNPSPLTNLATQALYPPGSTFKLVVAAAALENGYSKDTQLTGAPSIQLPGTAPGTTLTNYASTQCPSGPTATMEQALAYSCNTAFAELAGKLGAAKLKAQASLFGIGQNLSIPLPVAPSTVGPMPDQASVYQSGIGQRDVALTPLQNAEIAATIANGGVRMQPYLVKSILAPDLSTVATTTPKAVGRAMSTTTANTLRDMMIQSEQYSTGGKTAIANVTIASKTGTAEHGASPKTTPPHTWYVAFAPAQNPTIAVAVIVENGGDKGLNGVGATVAGPVGRAFIAAALGGG